MGPRLAADGDWAAAPPGTGGGACLDETDGQPTYSNPLAQRTVCVQCDLDHETAARRCVQ
ncbi:hypothetical protein GCM10010399_33440 [Dactylosporangium fulvum]